VVAAALHFPAVGPPAGAATGAPPPHPQQRKRPIDHPGRLKWVKAIAQETQGYRETRARALELVGKDRAEHGVWHRVSRNELAAGEVRTREGRVERLDDLVTRWVPTPKGRSQRCEWRECAGSLPGLVGEEVASPAAAEANRRWHDARAKGMRTHFDKVQECGLASTVYVSCPCCGCVDEHPAGCDSRTMCLTCRGRQNARKRREFLASRSIVLERAAAAGVTERRRRGGAFSEKFFTLTIPHLPEHLLTDRVLLVFTAWTFFLRSLNEWLRERDLYLWTKYGAELGLEHVQWYRHFECEAGDDEQGHPHFHVWFFGPYLPARPEDGLILQGWWCEALDKAARKLGLAEPNVAPDVLQLDIQGDLQDVEQELIKYLVKEVVGGGYIEPAWYARLFEVLDGRRVTQVSAGFKAAGDEVREQRTCRDCQSPVVRFKVAVRPNAQPEGNGCPNRCKRGSYSREAGCSCCGWSRAKMDRVLSEGMERGAYEVLGSCDTLLPRERSP
jgi:hypothetical protein